MRARRQAVRGDYWLTFFLLAFGILLATLWAIAPALVLWWLLFGVWP